MNILCVDDEPLALDELSFLIHEKTPEAMIQTAQSIAQALKILLTSKVDLLFLDIHLNHESGLELAQTLKDMPRPPLLVFATAYGEYGVKAFELDAFDYLLKPYDPQRLATILNKASERLKAPVSKDLEDAPDNDTIPLKVEESFILVPLREILVVEAKGKTLEITTKDSSYHITESLKSFAAKLPTKDFLQVHRSFLIQYRYIKEVQPWFNQTYLALMPGNIKVPVSRTYVREFKEILGL